MSTAHLGNITGEFCLRLAMGIANRPMVMIANLTMTAANGATVVVHGRLPV